MVALVVVVLFCREQIAGNVDGHNSIYDNGAYDVGHDVVAGDLCDHQQYPRNHGHDGGGSKVAR